MPPSPNKRAARAQRQKGRRPVPGIKSLEIGVRVLTSVARLPAAATLTEIANDARLDLSTCRRYLVSLINTGMVYQEDQSGKYDLGEHLFILGLRALMRGEVIRGTINHALALNREIDLTVIVSVWGDLGPTVVAWFDRSTKLICNSYIGSVYPLLTTATGRVFMAFQPDDSVMDLAAVELGARNPADLTPKQMARIARLRAAVRRDRIGMTDGEVIPGLSAIASPVFDCYGKIAAVVAVLTESRSLEGSARQRVTAELQATTDRVSLTQGFTRAPEAPGSFAEWLEDVWGHSLNRASSARTEAVRRRTASG